MPTVPDIHRRGTRAAQATIAAPPLTVGTLYYVTDETKTERWNGTAWETYGGPAAGAGPPTPHHTTHQAGGTDAIPLDTLAAPTDVTTLNASTTAHGLLRKLSGVTTDVLKGDGTWSAVSGGTPGAHASTHASAGSDPVTVTTLAGYPGGSTTFLRADGTFATPPTGAGGSGWPSSNFTAPVDANFAWVNQGPASVVAGNGVIFINSGLASSINLRIRKMAAPATPYTISAAFVGQFTAANYQGGGLVFRQSGTGAVHTFGIAQGASTYPLASTKWSSPTAIVADYVLRQGRVFGLIWLRIADDGTNRICSCSPDGYNWVPFHTVARTDFLTADEVGFYVNDQTNDIPAAMTVFSWKQG